MLQTPHGVEIVENPAHARHAARAAAQSALAQTSTQERVAHESCLASRNTSLAPTASRSLRRCLAPTDRDRERATDRERPRQTERERERDYTRECSHSRSQSLSRSFGSTALHITSTPSYDSLTHAHERPQTSMRAQRDTRVTRKDARAHSPILSRSHSRATTIAIAHTGCYLASMFTLTPRTRRCGSRACPRHGRCARCGGRSTRTASSTWG